MLRRRAEQIAGLDRFQTNESLKRLKELAERQRDEFDALDFVGQMGLGAGRVSGEGRNFIRVCLPGYWTQGEVTSLATSSSDDFLSVPDCALETAPPISRRRR